MAARPTERDCEGQSANKEQQLQTADELIISPSDLLPGDILLFRSLSQKAPAKQISAATGSPYTHAAIYLGDGEIAESNPPRVRTRKLSDADFKDAQIGVLRSQLGFSDRRAAAIREFVGQLVAQNASYDFKGVLMFRGNSKEFHERLLEQIAANYGKTRTTEEFLKQSYFCSALVVACYIIAGVIGNSAQVAYPPNVISPGDLHRDPTFGWVLGYILPKGATVPANDPLMFSTLWKDNEAARWW
jgi:uncharacterized protein YycO